MINDELHENTFKDICIFILMTENNSLRKCSRCRSTILHKYFSKNRKGEYFKCCDNCKRKKKDKLDESELKLIEAHSLNSARLLLRLKASAEGKARILVPMFEHHLKYDLSGYPHEDWKKPLTLFGKIISIADKYDTLTSSRVYRKSLLSPDRALGYMYDRANKDFDPILIKVFINIMGIYPVGTLLRLDTGELALVASSPSRDFAKRPLVCILEKEEDGSYKKKEIINLDERDPETGNYVRGITETYHPSTLGIQPVQHIFSS